MWAEYYAAPVPPGETNWAAYSHEELHEMLWQDADLAEVGAVADEWGHQHTALAEHAVSLRDQQGVMRASWEGAAGELAATRLGELADRVDDISAQAAAVQRAAQDAGDALARARAMMPPPAMPTGTDWSAMPASYAPAISTFAPPAVPDWSAGSGTTFFMTFGTPPSTAFNSLATGGTSMFADNFAAEQAKAQAVYTMRVYESSLSDGGNLVATHAARSYGTGRVTSVPAPAPEPSGGQFAGPQPGGVPWERLVGGDPLRPGPAVGAGVSAPGGVVSTMPGVPQEPSAGRAAANSGMVPPMSPRGGHDDAEDHTNHLPVIDQGLFIVETRTSAPVIGVHTMGVQP